MLCCWIENPNSLAVRRHLSRIKDYLWVAEDGMKMQVANLFKEFDLIVPSLLVCHLRKSSFLILVVVENWIYGRVTMAASCGIVFLLFKQ